MASVLLVIDEWLLHDLGGDNGREKQGEAFSFLQKLKSECDQIAVVYGSPWLGKAHQVMSNPDVRVRVVSRYLHRVVLADPAKCRFIHETELVVLPEGLTAVVRADDQYLFRLCRTVGAAKLITTDGGLSQIDCTPFGFEVEVQLREAFLSDYLQGGRG